MFESAELGHEISKEVYEAEVPGLREALLDAQYDLREAKSFPVLIVIGGIETAGKSEVVQTLNEWMDPRFIHTHGFLLPTGEEAERPPMYRFWRALPPKGDVGIFFGSWYTLPVLARLFDKTDDNALDRSIARIRHLERMLHNEGVLILKIWLHVTKKEQNRRLRQLEKDRDTRWRVTKVQKQLAARYDEQVTVAERVLRETSTGEAPWIVVDGSEHRYRTLTVGKVLLEAMRRRLDQPAVAETVTAAPVSAQLDNVKLVRDLDLSQRIEKDDYKDQLEKYQQRLGRVIHSKKFRLEEVSRTLPHPGLRGLRRRGQGRGDPARDGGPGCAALQGGADRGADRGGAGATLPLALLAPGPRRSGRRHLRPDVVRAGARRAGGGLLQRGRLDARLRRDQ